MSSINLNQSDALFNQKLQEFNAGMEEYGATLGFSAEAEAAAMSASVNFSNSLSANDAAKAAAKGAAATKTATRKNSTAVVRSLAAQVKSNPLATPAIIAAFGMNPQPTPTGTVSIPTMLVAQPQPQGFAKLVWKRNGNSSSTVFVIQARTALDNWAIIGTSTKASFSDFGAAPGVPKWYRIRAERAGQVSPWTSEVSIYSAGEDSAELMVA